jgi:xanthine dehydrogenase accessory factor
MDENEKVLQQALQTLGDNQAACLVTLIEVRGSTPRGTGAKILVRGDGSTAGTIGGGAMEAAVVRDALSALEEGESRIESYSLRDQDDLAACGGEVRAFLDVLRVSPTLLVAGAGHVCQPLAELGHLLGFRVVVVDDRADLLTQDRFPHADRLPVGTFDAFLDHIAVTPSTYIVIVTRGHEYDATVLSRVLGSPAPYIGMIGSLKKVRSVFEALVAAGHSEAELARVHAPIGLGLGGQTPAEIALSVMAEIILVKYGGNGQPLSWSGNPLRDQKSSSPTLSENTAKG